MIDRGLALEALAWLLTYGLHSTLLLCAAWYLTSRPGLRSERAKEGIWKTALVGGFLTTTLQVGVGMGPEFGRMTLREQAPAAVVVLDTDVKEVTGRMALPGTPPAARRQAAQDHSLQDSPRHTAQAPESPSRGGP